MSSEEWRWIPGYENRYEASSLGRIRSWRGGKDKRSPRNVKPLKLHPNWNKYLLVNLSHGKGYSVHRLIALTFHGPCPEGLECSHLNGNRQDNRAVNLKYVTRKENHSHKNEHGTAQRGEKGSKAKLTNEDVLHIRALCQSGVTQVAVSKVYGICFSTVSCIMRRKTWTHI